MPHALVLVLAAAFAAAPAPAPAAAATTAPAAVAGLDLAHAEIVDLTHAFDEKTLYWPNSPSAFTLETLADGPTPGGWHYSSFRFCAPEHGGTHLDAPRHFAAGAHTADEVPAAQLVAPAVVIDVAAKAAADPDYRLSAADVDAWESANGTIPKGAIVLLHTGWDARYPDRKAYFGDDTPGATDHLHFPSYGVEAVQKLLARGVGAIGVDTPSIDYGPSSDFQVHRLAAAAEVAGLENLTGLGKLPPKGAWIVALPMKIAGGSGGPVRAIGLVPR